MAEAAKAADGEALSVVDQTIIAYVGDARAAVAGLLKGNEELREELARTNYAVSFGYSRGWHGRREQANG